MAVYKTMYDITFESTKYICIHGQLVKVDDTLAGTYTYSFQKVQNGTHVTTCRQYLDQFDTYAELVAAFPGQEVPPENMM